MPTGLTPQIRNAEEWARARGDVMGRVDMVRTLAEYIATVKGFPELRGFWTFGSINEAGNALDESGQGRTLTNNSATARDVYENVVPYILPDGAADFFSRADEAGTSIIGEITFGGWFWLDAIPGTSRGFITKDDLAASRSYGLYVTTVPNAQLGISQTGAAIVLLTGSIALSTGVWYNVVGRFRTTEMALFTNGQKETLTAGLPASIFDGVAPFNVGSINSLGARVYDGRAFGCWLCATDISDNLILLAYHRSKSLFGLTC